MKSSVLIKSLTLLGFVSLVMVFIFYRMGKFDTYFLSNDAIIQNSSNGGTIVTASTDTLTMKQKDSLRILMMSSSKSIILPEKGFQLRDTSKFKKKYLKPGKTNMLSSSKSSLIVDPQKRNFYVDSLQNDSIKAAKKTNR